MMRPDQMLVSHLAAALLALTVAGVLVRGRGRLCWSFLVYLSALLVGNRLTTWWPELFYTHDAWNIKSFAYAALLWAVAFEMALLTFVMAPRARRRALRVMGFVTVFAAVAAVVPSVEATYLTVLGVLAPRGETAALWLFLVVFGLAAWHRLPLHPYHRAIVLGSTLYLTFDVVILVVLGARASSQVAYSYLAALEPLAFAATVAFWAWAAWRPLEVQRGVLSRLQPWAV